MAGGYNDDRNRDRWRDDDRERSSWRSGSQGTNEREDERGFFERAGDEVRSWFSDDDNDRRDRDFGRSSMQRSSWDREQNRGFSSEPSRGREFGREERSSFGGMAQGGYGRSSGQFGRDRDWSDQSKRNFGGFRDEADFTSQRRSRPQTWGATDHGQSSWDQGMSHLGYGDFSGTLGGFGNQRFGSSQDDHYRSWRDRQMAQLDQDYDDYCREREQQFNQDFDSWRSTRQGQGSASTSSASSSDRGATPNAGVGTTTSSVTGTAGSGSAIGGQPMGSPEASDATTGTGTADTGVGTGGRSGSRSRS
jgi:hypothetical protein